MNNYITLLFLLLGTSGVWAQQSCATSDAANQLQTNYQKAAFNSHGTAFYDKSLPAQQIPYTANQTAPTTVFAAAPWLSARDTGDNLMVMATTYGENFDGYDHGPLDAVTGAPIATTCNTFNQVWRVSRWAIERLRTDFQDNGVIDSPVETELLEWPGRGNPHFLTRMGYALPNQDLAPFYDQNSDGIYDPMQGDYPVFKTGVATAVAEELLWTVFHSTDTEYNNGGALKLEIQQTAYALDCGSNDLLNLSLFINHKLINRANTTRYQMRYGNWTDFDLGCASDDYVGSIPSKNTVYAYNQDANDDDPCGAQGGAGYGVDPPVYAVTFLNQTMTSAIYNVNNIGSPPSNPTSAVGYENQLRGLFANGTPMTPGGDGYDPQDTTTPPVLFMFPSNPNDFSPGSWSMATASLSGLDQRTIGAIYRDSMPAGAVWDIDIAYSYHHAPTTYLWQNVDLMETQLDSLQLYYDNGLENFNCPSTSNCVVNCVYPGDANNNGIANDFDILEMGLAYGQTAAPRALAGDRWAPYAPPTPVTNAYLDANGLGQVDDLDLTANTQNWDLTHSLYTGASEGSNAVGTDLYLERFIFPPIGGTVATLGGLIRVNPYFGDTTNNPITVQGLTYRIRYDAQVLGAAHVNNGTDLSGWLSADGAPIFHRFISEPNVLHVVTSRLDNGNYTGGGMLGGINFRIQPDAFVNADTMYTQICFEDFKAVLADGTVLTIGAECLTIPYTDPTYNAIRALAEAPPVRLYPNPAREAIQLDLGQASAKTVELLDLLGQPIQTYQEVQGQLTIAHQQLPKGLYLIRISFENGSESTHKVVFQ